MPAEVIPFKEPEPPKCAFCGRTKCASNPLIGEPGRPHICYACVERCNQLLEATDGRS